MIGQKYMLFIAMGLFIKATEKTQFLTREKICTSEEQKIQWSTSLTSSKNTIGTTAKLS